MRRDENTVVIHTELGNYCLREKMSAEYRLWLLLRELDPAGGAYVSYEAIFTLPEKLDQTAKRLRQVIQRGMNIFWLDEGDGLRYSSKTRLAKILGLGWLGDRIQVDNRCLYGPLRYFKASVYACNFVRGTEKGSFVGKKGEIFHGGKTISRATLTKITGISRPTQYEYEEMMGIKVDAQFAYADQGQIADVPIADRLVGGKNRGVFLRDINGDGQKEIVWQTPSRFSTQGLKFLGRTKRIPPSGCSDDYSAPAGHARHQRFFYDSPHTFKKLPRSSVAVFTHTRKGHLSGRYMRYYHIVDG